MEYRNLGHSGLKVSLAGVGTNNFGARASQDMATAVVHRALELGVNFFDTADMYGPDGISEQFLGNAIAGERENVLIATKFRSPMGEGPLRAGASRRYIMQAVEASLRRLGTDYIDLYQIHGPDPETPIEETMRALDDLVHQGKVRYIGHSNFSAWQATECHYVAKLHSLTPFISAQNEYSLLERHIESDLVPVCKMFGLSILPYFPLAMGMLTGKYKQDEPMPEGTRLTQNPRAQLHYMTDRNWQILAKLTAFTEKRGRTMTDLALGWLASQAHVGSVIAGAMYPEQVEANVAAVGWRLSPEELSEVDAMSKP